MVQMAAGSKASSFDTEWVAALAGLFIGQAAALQAYQLGLQVAFSAWKFHSGASMMRFVLVHLPIVACFALSEIILFASFSTRQPHACPICILGSSVPAVPT